MEKDNTPTVAQGRQGERVQEQHNSIPDVIGNNVCFRGSLRILSSLAPSAKVLFSEAYDPVNTMSSTALISISGRSVISVVRPLCTAGTLGDVTCC